VIEEITPAFGPPASSTLVSIFGRHFANGTEYGCRFGASSSIVEATYVQDRERRRLLCQTPLGDGGDSLPLEVTTNGQDFSGMPMLFDLIGRTD
jgi:hypothetical protein